jgi:hypothetical protein
MSEYPSFGRGGGSADDGRWKIQGGRGSGGGRSGLAGYGRHGGRDGGRGRGSGTNNGQQKNRYEQFSDGDFKDAEEEEIDDDANAFDDEEDEAVTGKTETDELYKAEDFITEEEMQLKGNTATEGKKNDEMVGVETVIQKKRALSLSDAANSENPNTDTTKTAEKHTEGHSNDDTATTDANKNKEKHGDHGNDDNAAAKPKGDQTEGTKTVTLDYE